MPSTSSTQEVSPVEPETDQSSDSPYFERIIYFEEGTPLPNQRSTIEYSGVRILQKWNSDESGVVWDSSLLLAKYLELLVGQASDKFANKTVIELGAGTGFLGLWLASFGSRVLLTDLPNHLDLLHRNLRLNSNLINQKSVQITAFDWLDTSQRQIESDFLRFAPIRSIDYFIVSDCLYYKEGIQAIYELIIWVLVDCQCKGMFLISYEDREDKMEMIERFIQLLQQNPALAVGKVAKTSLHPEYVSEDLHVLEIAGK